MAILFADTATTDIYTLSLHDALPIFRNSIATARKMRANTQYQERPGLPRADDGVRQALRSEEHTSELQSLTNLVCRLLLEKKKTSGNIRVPAKRNALVRGSHKPSGEY